MDPKRKLQRMLSILSTSHIYTETFNVESKTKGMISGLYQDFLLPKSRARFQTPPSEIVPIHDFVEKCTISCRPSFWEEVARVRISDISHCTLYSSTLYGCTVTLYVYPAVPRLPQSQTSHNNTHFAVPEYLCAAKRGAEVLSVRRHLASVAFDSTCRDLPTSAKVLRQELRARPAAGGVSATH